MYQYRTASFILTGQKHGAPLQEVDDAIGKFQSEGWEFVQLTSSATVGALSVVLVLRREAASNP